MEIKNVTNIAAVKPLRDEVRIKKEHVDAEKKDNVEISEEAKELFNTKHTARIEMLKARVESGYYFSDEVTEKTAERILKSL